MELELYTRLEPVRLKVIQSLCFQLASTFLHTNYLYDANEQLQPTCYLYRIHRGQGKLQKTLPIQLVA